MEYVIASTGQQVDMAAQRFPHAALDAVALSGFAQHFAHGETDTRSRARNGRAGSLVFKRRRGRNLRCPRRKEPAHGCGLPLAGSRVAAQIIGVFAQACSRQ
jgi:hypothetical protein